MAEHLVCVAEGGNGVRTEVGCLKARGVGACDAEGVLEVFVQGVEEAVGEALSRVLVWWRVGHRGSRDVCNEGGELGARKQTVSGYEPKGRIATSLSSMATDFAAA